MKRLILSTMLMLVIPVVLLAQDWVKHIITDGLNGVNSIQCIDVDSDSAIDVLSTNINIPSYVSWWKNNGSGNFTMHTIDSSTTSTNYYLAIYGTQLNEDGYVDILAAGRSTIFWWKNDGNENFTEYQIGTSFTHCYSLFAAHVNDDEYLDVLGASYEDDDICWWENLDGSGTSWTEHPIDTLFDGAYSVYAEDINGDSAIDVIGAGQDADSICWWENMGGDPLIFTKHTIVADFNDAISAFVADMDDDGDVDVLGASYEDDDICWWENLDGSGTRWTEHPIDTLFDGANSIYAIDLDKDGDMDILGTGAICSEVVYWDNDGSENFTKIIIGSGINNPRSVSACDIDNDNDIDIIAASYGDDEIIWWENVLSDTDDVGPYSIDIPDIVPLDTTFKPKATVTNYGNVDQPSFLVTCIINDPDTYTSTKTIQCLAPHASIQFEFFSSFTFEGLGVYTIIVYTRLAGDEEPTNDTLAKVITAIGVAEEGINIPEAFNFTAPTISKRKSNITLALPEATKIDLIVYDATGRLCEMLISQKFSAGTHNIPVTLDLPTGVYFYNLKSESGRNITRKFLLIE
jgi:hypothetical protein